MKTEASLPIHPANLRSLFHQEADALLHIRDTERNLAALQRWAQYR